MPDNGIGYGLLNQKLDVKEPAFFFNYLGEIDLNAGNMLINQTGTRMSKINKQPEDIALSCYIYKGVLHNSIKYNKEILNEQKVMALLEEYLLAIEEIAVYCRTVKETVSTPSDFSAAELSMEDLENIQRKYGQQSVRDIYELTPMQEEMLFQYMKDQKDTSYVVQNIYQFPSIPDAETISKAYHLLIKRFSSLSTAVVYERLQRPYQIELSEREPAYKYIDLSNSNEAEREAALEEIKENDIKAGFSLSDEPLFRASYIHMGGSNDILLWSCHHIIMDGWSLATLEESYVKYYNALCSGMTETDICQEIELERNKETSFAEYVNLLSENDNNSDENYWADMMNGYDGNSQISFSEDASKDNMRSLKTDKWLTESVTRKIQQTAASLHVTVNTMVETCWGILLQKINNCNDVIFGKTVSGRDADIPEIEKMVGILINTIPVRIQCEQEISVSELIKAIQAQANSSKDYDYYPLANMTGLNDGMAANLGSLVVFENYSDKQDTDCREFYLINKEYREETNIPLNLISGMEDNRLRISLMFKTSEYTQRDISRILNRLELLLTGIASDPALKVKDLCLVSDDEKNLILNDWNQTFADYPKEQAIIPLFEEQVIKYGDKCAVTENGRSVTYAELNARANYWADQLRKSGIKKNDLVAITAERNIETIVGIYAILKSGAVYVPIDLKQPAERIKHILNDSSSKVLVASEVFLDVDMPVIKIGLFEKQMLEGLPFCLDYSQQDLAYVIYTSGTTGVPKGVMVTQKNVVKLVVNADYIPLNTETVLLQTGQIAFDASTFEIWGCGLNGGELNLISEEELLDTDCLKKRVAAWGINTAFFTTALFRQITDNDPHIFSYFKYLLVGGEAISEKHVHKLHSLYPEIVLKNIYGPTETTTFATVYEISKERRKTPIGKPISNTQAYIMQADVMCGIGMTGELCIAGDGVSNGYLNNPDLTADRFAANPYGSNQMYRTGDLARWDKDGNIEYLGRGDEQVKINGFRIELGEIENALKNISELNDAIAAVVAEDDLEMAICAYYVAQKEVNLAELKAKLAETLPAYMMPKYFVKIDNIVLNRNGKVDKKSLPLPIHQCSHEYLPPRTEKELMICETFSEILNTEKVGVKDDFFDLDGNSIKIIRLINMIEKKAGYRFKVRDIYTCKTPESLAAEMDIDSKENFSGIAIAEEKDYYPMSSTQKRVYFAYNLAPDSTAYNIPYCCRIYGELDEKRLKNALQAVADRHEILRTGFSMFNDVPVQQIFDHVKMDITGYQGNTKSEEEWMKEFIRPFDLTKPPLIRVGIVKGKEYSIFMMDVHHIICDGMSLSILMAELSAHYNGAPLPDIRQYKDYSEWMTVRDLTRQKDYWMNRFSDNIPVLDLPLDYNRPVTQSYSGAVTSITLNQEISDAIIRMKEQYGISEYMICLSAAMILLSKYSAQDDIIIGSPIFTRTSEDMENMLGMFVNTLPMRGMPNGNKYCIDFLQEIKADCIEAYEHQEFPFEELVDNLRVKRDLSRNPLFDVMLVMQNKEEAGLKLRGMRIESVEFHDTVAKFDLKFDIRQNDGSFKIDLEYCTALFNRYFADRMLKHLLNLLALMTADPQKRIKEYNLSDEAEQAVIVNDFNHIRADYDIPKTVVSCVREQAALNPEKTAVRMGSERLSFAELDKCAKNIAAALRKKGVQQNELAAVYAERNIGMIAGLLGAMYAGAGYVPINTSYPGDRIKYLLQDSQARAVLISGVDFDLDVDVEVINITDYRSYLIGDEGVIDSPLPGDLAYCIYTSGTTGFPKGVLVEHQSLMNNMWFSKEIFLEDTANIRTPLFSSHCFDLSMPSIFLPLCFGGVLELIEPDREHDLAGLMNSGRYSFFKMTPSHAKMLLDEPQILENNVTLAVGGEILEPSLVSELKRAYGDKLNVYNEYGPTEATVFSTVYRCNEVETERRIPIGRPLPNTQVYIMEDDKLCGIGIPGEILIGGMGVAGGYLNRPELTREKFINNPYNTGRLYKTGDIGRWREDGNIEFIGRRDNQVKIHGYRIELGEIENALKEIKGIRDSAVIVRADEEGEKSLHAYYVCDHELNTGILRTELVNHIPEYMIPVRFARLDLIPLTKNGKLDQQSLPELAAAREYEYTTPKTETEKALCTAFEEVIGVENVGMKDNFFDLGGDSIKAIRIVTRMRNSGHKLDVKQIMGSHNVEAVSRELTAFEAGSNEPEEVSGEVIPTPIMTHFLNSQIPHPEYLTQDVMLNIDTDNAEVIKEALNAVTKHHDMIRSVCHDGKFIINKINEGQSYAFRVIDLSSQNNYEEKMEASCTREQKQIDIEKGPLLSAILFRLPNNNKLFLCMHHICVDGISWQILLDDLKKGIKLCQNGEEIKLDGKPLSYPQWALTLHQYKSKISSEEKKYWQDTENNIKNAIFRTAPGISGNKMIQKEMDEYSTRLLIRGTNKAYHTEVNDLMLSALTLAVKNTTNQERVFIALEGHGREEIAEDISADGTVGWFTCKYPVILKCSPDIREAIVETKESLRKVPKHGIGYGVLKGGYKGLKNSISLNYLGVMDSENAGSMIFNKSMSATAYQNNLTGMMDIDCYIEKGRLYAAADFNPKVMNYEDAKALMDAYLNNLKAVIYHCIEKQEPEKTASDYSADALTRMDLDKIRKKYKKDEIADIYELTPLQEGMLYHHTVNKGSSEYVVQHIFKIDGWIKEKTIKEALMLLTDKHEVLKTAVMHSKTIKPWQIVLKNRKVSFMRISPKEPGSEVTDRFIKELGEEIVNEGFNLETESLLKVTGVWLGDNGWQLIWTYHHMVMDGWCASVLFGDFLDYCLRLTKGETLSAIHKKIVLENENKGSFADYVKWISEGNEDSLSYWSEYLSGYEGTAELKPMLKPDTGDVQMKRDGIRISGGDYDTLVNMARDMKITLNTVIEAAVGIMLQRYNHSRDVVFGKVVSGRNAEINEIESIAGLFVNTIPLRVTTNGDETVEELLLKMHTQGIDGVENSRCSLSQIQQAINYQGELIKVLYAFENYYVDENRMNVCGFEMKYEREQTNYAVTITAYTDKENLCVDILYNPNEFLENEIQLMLNRITQVIVWLSRNKKQPVEKAETVTVRERHLILDEFNDTDSVYPDSKTVAELVERQSAMNPEHIAVIDGEKEISYQQLNEKANQVAHKLRSLGVKPNDYVAVMAERTWQTVAGIYGILKSGGAYVPIDPDYPEKSRQYIMDDCQPKALLTTGGTIDTEITAIDLSEEAVWEEEKDNPKNVNQAQDLAYLIYTSGTTGKPKGSMIPHQGIVRLVCNTNYIKYDGNTVFLQTGSMAFDASTMELWGPLTNGGKLILTGSDVVTSIPDMKTYLKKYHVTTVWLTSSLYNQMIQEAPEMFDGLKYLMIGGEKLSEKHVRIFKQRHTSVKMLNGYGPTENTTFTTTYTIPDDFEQLPIGKPIANTKVYIMDGDRLCGIGVPGELCTTGDGLSRGYLNQPDLTAEKFLDNPFGRGWMYKTGDIAKWLPDGNIAYLGRTDDQVKIHGFRIEIGEVEAAFRAFEEIKEAAVLIKGTTAEDKALAAYLVADTKLDVNEIRERLKDAYPHYMIPQYLMQVEEIPITTNGKLDKERLPEIQDNTKQIYAPPRSEEERILCESFQEILHIEKVGIYDSFYERGGDSIKAIRIVSQMRTQGFAITVKEIMNRYQISEIAKVTSKIESNRYNQGEANGTALQTPIIKKFADLGMAGKGNFYQDVCMKIRDCTLSHVQTTLRTLMVHHDVLRAVFCSGTLKILPVKEARACEITSVDMTGRKDWQEEIAEYCRVPAEGFDVTKGPLMKAVLFDSNDGTYIWLAVHHLAVDGISWRIIMEDFGSILDQIKNQKEVRIPDKTASYINWTEKVNQYKDSGLFKKRSGYWHELLGREINGALNLGAVLEQSETKTRYGTRTFELDRTISSLLKFEAVKMFHTGVNEIILGALCMTVFKITSQEQILVMLEGHGREEIHEEIDISRTVGWFTTLYPVLLDCFTAAADNIVNTKEILNGVPNNGLEYGLIDCSNTINPDIMFNYLGEMEGISESELLRFGSGEADSEGIKMISPLSISAIILNGNIKFTFTYNMSRFSDEDISLFVDCYRETVTECINYCSESENSFHTVSDLLKDDIEEEDLEMINALFADLA